MPLRHHHCQRRVIIVTRRPSTRHHPVTNRHHPVTVPRSDHLPPFILPIHLHYVDEFLLRRLHCVCVYGRVCVCSAVGTGVQSAAVAMATACLGPSSWRRLPRILNISGAARGRAMPPPGPPSPEFAQIVQRESLRSRGGGMSPSDVWQDHQQCRFREVI